MLSVAPKGDKEMVEEFSFTTKYFDKEVREANNQLAALSWARLTWEQRVEKHLTIHANKTFNKHNTNYIVVPIHALFRRPIKCETLSQMQF